MLLDWIERKLGKPEKKIDEFWNGLEIDKALHRNGILIGRARKEQRSLTYEERQIIVGVRKTAAEFGFNVQMINMIEMEGETNKDLVYEPVKVKVAFAYWNSGCYGFPAYPEYLILKSNHPSLPVHGSVSRETLEKNNIKVPSTPSLERWVAKGRPCFRG